jgi:uncharacterized protein YggE
MVTLKDIKTLEPLVEAALKSGANVLQGIEFRTTEHASIGMRHVRLPSRRRRKSTALARDLSAAIGAPRTVSESGGYWYPQSDASASRKTSSRILAALEKPSETPLGQIAVRATVSVTFDLVPGPP